MTDIVINNLNLFKDFALAARNENNIIYAIPFERLIEICQTKGIKRFSELEEGFVLEDVFRLNPDRTEVENHKVNILAKGLIFIGYWKYPDYVFFTLSNEFYLSPL